jgi:hypothetical protein
MGEKEARARWMTANYVFRNSGSIDHVAMEQLIK